MEAIFKLPVGRPVEDTIERQDLTGYKLSSKYKRQLNAFFKYWDNVVNRIPFQDVK